MKRPVRKLLFAVLLTFLTINICQAQQRPGSDPFAEASRWTVGIMTGAMDQTALRLASDMADQLNDGPQFRIVPMIGESSIRNVVDLFYLDGVDAVIVQSDVLNHLRRTSSFPKIDTRLQYVAKLHSAEFHVLSRMDYLCLADLAGRKVNFGPEGSGSALSAQAIFGASQIQVQPQYLPHSAAAEKLRKGELDAMVFVSGKPSGAFEHIHYTDRVHFLDVGFSSSLHRDYLPAILTHDDYPDLIAPQETVSTVAVSAVLAVERSGKRKPEKEKLARLVERFFGEIETLKQSPYHAKWSEVTLSAPVNGWTRFPPAQQWLKTNPDAGFTQRTVRSGAE